jgi:hypothetical protein
MKVVCVGVGEPIKVTREMFEEVLKDLGITSKDFVLAELLLHAMPGKDAYALRDEVIKPILRGDDEAAKEQLHKLLIQCLVSETQGDTA